MGGKRVGWYKQLKEAGAQSGDLAICRQKRTKRAYHLAIYPGNLSPTGTKMSAALTYNYRTKMVDYRKLELLSLYRMTADGLLQLVWSVKDGSEASLKYVAIMKQYGSGGDRELRYYQETNSFDVFYRHDADWVSYNGQTKSLSTAIDYYNQIT